MHYNIVFEVGKNFFFFIKKSIHYGDGNETEIPESIGNVNEIQFLIPVRYKYGNK